MARLLYFTFPSGGVQGGHKVIVRHVETLRELGFDAHCLSGAEHAAPNWFDSAVPIVTDFEFRGDDVIVLPDDAHDSLRRTPKTGLRCVVIAQNPYLMASLSLAALDGFPEDRPPRFMAVSPGLAATLRRLYPKAQVDVVPCFADERRFRPAADKIAAIACSPKKRPLEASAIAGLFPRLHPRHAHLAWRALANVREAEMAAAFAESSLFLSLSRLESVGLTPLEAMASGCVCAGFLGVGGHEFATAENGFWAPDEDCVAAADALAEAADVVATGGPELRRRIEAGRATAEAWSYARFRERLEAFWMAAAPDSRIRSSSLD